MKKMIVCYYLSLHAQIFTDTKIPCVATNKEDTGDEEGMFISATIFN
jgi:hypothetical protein